MRTVIPRCFRYCLQRAKSRSPCPHAACPDVCGAGRSGPALRISHQPCARTPSNRAGSHPSPGAPGERLWHLRRGVVSSRACPCPLDWAAFRALGGWQRWPHPRISTLARSQPIWPCSRKRRSLLAPHAHTPAVCQSRKRRQQVMPLPKPSFCGSSSQAIPVCRTYTMLFNAARSSTVRLRPPSGDGVNAGINASRATHNLLLIFRLVTPPGYGGHRSMCGLC